jgi:hypothetical protein
VFVVRGLSQGTDEKANQGATAMGGLQKQKQKVKNV